MSTYQADIIQVHDLLKKWLHGSTDAKGNEWLKQKIVTLSEPVTLKDFYLAFGLAPRMVGRLPLQLSPEDLNIAQQLRKGLTPIQWTTEQAARILILLMLPHDNKEEYIKALDQLFTTAEVGELTALYLALPLLPHPEALRFRASEGVRTNMSVVFNALALDNPYPMEYMDEAAWNQMVLKSVFIGSPLHRIQGLDQRANATLARILRDFVHERWAAGRPVTHEVWRIIAPFVDDAVLTDVEHLFEKGTETEQQAAVLLCMQGNHISAKSLALSKRPDLVEQIKNKELTWDTLR
ncbi:EboA domain-containing protein [Xanthocytophaga agilis]|uniref:EboA domain-containing protein n=1 Tax=Xanthocytophaga agilis TaxID=3048010 RepID=A0AAE3UBM6_9BACT|nr:EboA domain-containing protein [Xanthocytophaga agilis]MDJ1500008.1 EboA domain-containing protein [Xanthocytophaga agilis]